MCIYSRCDFDYGYRHIQAHTGASTGTNFHGCAHGSVVNMYSSYGSTEARYSVREPYSLAQEKTVSLLPGWEHGLDPLWDPFGKEVRFSCSINGTMYLRVQQADGQDEHGRPRYRPSLLRLCGQQLTLRAARAYMECINRAAVDRVGAQAASVLMDLTNARTAVVRSRRLVM